MPATLHHTPARGSARRVFLAIPSYGTVPNSHAFALFRGYAALTSAGYEVEVALRTGDCHVDDARNSLVATFLASACDDLVFIDADIGWQDDDLLRLLSHDRDIVGGTYPLKQGLEDFPCRHLGEEIWSDESGLIEVEGLPTGFLRIRRNVLARLAEDAEQFKLGDAVMPLVFERTVVNGGRMSGDVNFCRKARAAGFKVWLDPHCYMEHVGEKSWFGTYASFLKCRSGLGLVDGIERIRNGTEDARSLVALSHEWGNEPYSASIELLKTVAHIARQLKGDVLETGSGLTSLIMAAANPAITVHCLEHSAVWGAKTREAAKRLGLPNIVIHEAPLVDTPAGRWYDVPRMSWDFDLVLCDGPPRKEGNRRILWGVLATHDCRPRCILVDDADTEGESVPADYRTEIKGQIRKFAVGLRN